MAEHKSWPVGYSTQRRNLRGHSNCLCPAEQRVNSEQRSEIISLAVLGLLNLQRMLLCETAEKTMLKEVPRGVFTNTAMGHQWALVEVVSCVGKSRINPITFWGRENQEPSGQYHACLILLMLLSIMSWVTNRK